VNATIQERLSALFSEYDVSAPGITYSAQKALTTVLDKLELIDGAGSIVATIQGHFSLVYAHYDFAFADGRSYDFRCEKVFKGVYVCERQDEVFHLYLHKDYRFSLFQGEKQIAAMTRDKLVIGDGHEYAIRMNADADVALLSCMVIAMSSSHHNALSGSKDTLDLSHIGFEDRRFDEYWAPS
jgi:uncharacterized protein YxjI